MSAPPTKGRLVVASPALEDPNFHRTVVFLLAADDDGALGVVLNRPSETAIDEVVPHWGLHASEPPVLFVGGPVQPNAAICVGRTQNGAGEHPAMAEPPYDDDADDETDVDAESEGFSPLIGDLGTVDLNRAPDEIGVAFTGLRVFTGYSGWGPGQLEEEIEAGAWFVVEGRQTDVLCAEPADLWERVLRRQGGWLAVLARHPVDASLN
jgi:putative transcriptional regulator